MLLGSTTTTYTFYFCTLSSWLVSESLMRVFDFVFMLSLSRLLTLCLPLSASKEKMFQYFWALLKNGMSISPCSATKWRGLRIRCTFYLCPCHIKSRQCIFPMYMQVIIKIGWKLSAYPHGVAFNKIRKLKNVKCNVSKM